MNSLSGGSKRRTYAAANTEETFGRQEGPSDRGLGPSEDGLPSPQVPFLSVCPRLLPDLNLTSRARFVFPKVARAILQKQPLGTGRGGGAGNIKSMALAVPDRPIATLNLSSSLGEAASEPVANPSDLI